MSDLLCANHGTPIRGSGFQTIYIGIWWAAQYEVIIKTEQIQIQIGVVDNIFKNAMTNDSWYTDIIEIYYKNLKILKKSATNFWRFRKKISAEYRQHMMIDDLGGQIFLGRSWRGQIPRKKIKKKSKYFWLRKKKPKNGLWTLVTKRVKILHS